MRVVTALGQDLRVTIRTGTGDGPPLLLCCGIGAGFEALQPFVDALDPAIEVIRFDVPGVGGSPAGPVPYGFPGTAYLAARMVRQLGYPQVDVLGLSWGGALAQQLALQHRHLVRKLVLVSTSTGSVMVPGHPRVLIRMFTPRRFRDPDYAASIAAILYGGSAREYPDQVRQILGDSMRIGSKTGYLHQLLAGVGWTSLPWLRLVRQPTLILAGNDDPIVPLVNARILRCLLPNAELHVYDGGHVALVTEAAVLAPIVARFLNDHPHSPETPTTRRGRR
jgi:poly(3-hydroxyalkanoate) depolymerase